MSEAKDLTGMRFGRLVVLGLDRVHTTPSGQKKPKWLCQCDCGKQKVIDGCGLKNGSIKSCGCLRSEMVAEKNTTHNHSNTRLYHIWSAMRARCGNERNHRFKWYGGKGISVCQDWVDFSRFENWALNAGYADHLTIDRIDSGGNYCPENCRWVDWKTQANNKSNNRRIEIDGITHTIAEWSQLSGVPASLISSRMYEGITGSRLLQRGDLRRKELRNVPSPQHAE